MSTIHFILGLANLVRKVIQDCTACQRAVTWNPKRVVYKQAVPLGPWLRIGVDLTSVEVESETHQTREIVVVVDSFSKWVYAKPVRKKSSRCVARILRDMLYLFGPPADLLSDSSGEFTRTPFQSLLHKFNAVWSHSRPYHPQTNGLVARDNATIKRRLHKSIQLAPERWAEALPSILYDLNQTVKRTTSFRPCQLMFGRDFSYQYTTQDRELMKARRQSWRTDDTQKKQQYENQYLED